MPGNQVGIPTAYIVDDGPAIRRAMGYLMESVGINCQIFDSATEFLTNFVPTMNRAGLPVSRFGAKAT